MASTNAGNSVAAADLTINADGTAIANTAPGGLVTLTRSVLQRGSEGAEAITNHGIVVANGVSLEGFAPPDGAATPLVGVLQGAHWQPRHAPSDPPLVDAPPQPADPVRTLGKCAARHAAGDQPRDITAALRRAMASGAATIYLPYGRYTISDGHRHSANGAADRRHERLDHGSARA